MSYMKNIKIIICDDHPLITEGIHSFIVQKNDMEVVATANSGAELMNVIREVNADVLLLDVNLPDDNGVDLCIQIKKLYPEMKILGLSNFNERSVIVRMLNNGASGYRSEEHTSELQSREKLVCRLLLEKKK